MGILYILHFVGCISDGDCGNGYCDTDLEECECDEGWTGPTCEEGKYPTSDRYTHLSIVSCIIFFADWNIIIQWYALTPVGTHI